jgi:hypothetical protein
MYLHYFIYRIEKVDDVDPIDPSLSISLPLANGNTKIVEEVN